jgi:5-methylcytosine-specific restriction endonuclease McrA
MERDGWTCQLCLDPIDPALRVPDPMAATLDHVVPLAQGGSHSMQNLQAAHFMCNYMKGDRRGVA